MRVRVDQEQCEGNARCQKAAPEVFEVRADDRSYVLIADVPSTLSSKVNIAIRVCPRQAIAWQEEDA